MSWLQSFLEPVGGLILVLLATGLMFAFAIPRPSAQRGKSRMVLHPILGMQRLRRAIGRAIEDGSRLHISIGKSSIISPNNASALVGFDVLKRISILSSLSDRPPVATSGDGTLALLSQDTMRSAYRISNVPEHHDTTQARMVGPTPFSYIAGTLPVAHDEHVSAHILVGNFGPEVALLTTAAESEDAFVLAASDSFSAQAVLYATASEALIGEELFAVPAYLQAGPIHQASLLAQDILRWILIAVLILGALVTLVKSL